MSSSAPVPEHPASLPWELAALVRRPTEIFPHLFRRGKAGSVLFFSAVSGIYFAYATAQGFGLGGRFGFGTTAVAVLVVGAVLGFLALFFAGGLLSWSAEALRGQPATERMYAVFGYATWPFLPLLIVIGALDYAMYGTALFDPVRPAAPDALEWLVRLLQLATIFLWLFLMVKGTALAAEFSDEQAVSTVALSIVEVAVIAVLFALILVVSLTWW